LRHLTAEDCQRVGIVVSFERAIIQTAQTARITQLLSMLDNMPINVILGVKDTFERLRDC